MLGPNSQFLFRTHLHNTRALTDTKGAVLRAADDRFRTVFARKYVLLYARASARILYIPRE